MCGYFVRENVIFATPPGFTHARVGVGDWLTGASAHPASAITHRNIEVRFRTGRQSLIMSNVEYLPVRTSDGSLALRVVLLTPLERLRRFLKKISA
jgi:hypothetical protein